MLFGCRPFDSEYVCDTIELIREAKLKFPVGNSISSLAKDFCMRLLTIKTEFRLTAVEAENHLWIQQYYEKEDKDLYKIK